MSLITYISFPRELKIFKLSDIAKEKINFGIDYVVDIFQEEVCSYSDCPVRVNDVKIVEQEDVIYHKCFKNLFIYNMYIRSLSNYKYDEKMKIIRENEREDIQNRELMKIWDEETLLRNQLLYTFLQFNLDVDEFVEIYIDRVVDADHDFEPPSSESIVYLEELLIFPNPKKRVKGHKFTILKTK